MKDIEKKRRVTTFALETTAGETLHIGQGSQRPTFLIFFTLSCSSCLEAAPIVWEALAPYTDRAHIIAVGRDQQAQELETWQSQTGTHYQLVADPERHLFSQFAKLHVPRFYLIDTEGKVRYQDVNWHPLMLSEIKEAAQQFIG